MNHEVTEEGKAIVVAFEGDVDLSVTGRAQSPSRKGRPVIVDMAGVSYIDSSGVASLVESLQAARKAGCEFALAAVSEPALRVLHLARLDTVFTIHESREAALAEIG